jgi:ribosomal protein L11 methyltransferase
MQLAKPVASADQTVWRARRGIARHWLERFARPRKSKPIKIGKRLVILRSGTFPARKGFEVGKATLLMPARMAFGTGEHATTAMSLRLLEQLTCRWNRGWTLVDLGTGSGILALAAKRFGAGRVVGIDDDPTAISMAKSNARLNKILAATFQLGNVRDCKPPQETDVITANLYRDLLIEMLPRLRGRGWLLLSGILRTQEDEFARALRRNRIGEH